MNYWNSKLQNLYGEMFHIHQ